MRKRIVGPYLNKSLLFSFISLQLFHFIRLARACAVHSSVEGFHVRVSKSNSGNISHFWYKIRTENRIQSDRNLHLRDLDRSIKNIKSKNNFQTKLSVVNFSISSPKMI